MDAVKFLKERKRLCQMYEVCRGCPANRIGGGCIFSVTNGASPEEQTELMEAWSTAHPPKTRQDVFLEQYPEALLDVNGLLDMCPAPIFLSHRLVGGGCRDPHKKCVDCKREFWLQEVEQKER